MNPSARRPAEIIESPPDLKKLLEGTRAIAVVGISDKPERDSHSISAYLKDHGYTIIGINPTLKTVLGEPCYPSLAEVPEVVRKQIGFVAIFRKPGDAPAIIEEAARLGLKTAWLVPGSGSPEALDAAGRVGVKLVVERCLRVAHSTLLG